MARSYRYLLGDSRREAARLRAQAKLWDPVSLRLFDRLGIKRGWKILEIGPGQGSLHLELRRRARGPVDAVERSPAFAERLSVLRARDGHGGRTWVCDLIDAPLPRAHYDLIFARWVFLFLPDADAHLRKLAAALKPGGRIAIQDYHRATFDLVPRPPEFPDFVAADRAFFATQGGDVSVGTGMAARFRRAGLRPEPLSIEVKSGGPGTPTWDWIQTYVESVLERYARLRPFTPAKAARLRRFVRAAARKPDSLFIAPAVLDCVARRPRR